MRPLLDALDVAQDGLTELRAPADRTISRHPHHQRLVVAPLFVGAHDEALAVGQCHHRAL